VPGWVRRDAIDGNVLGVDSVGVGCGSMVAANVVRAQVGQPCQGENMGEAFVTPSSSRHGRTSRWRPAVACMTAAVTVGTFAVTSALDASAATRSSATTSSSATLPPAGGPLSISTSLPTTAPPKGTCTAVVVPTQPDVPAGVACSPGSKVKVPAFISGNTASKPVKVTLHVQDCAGGAKCYESPPVTVTQWAYAVSLTSSAAPWGTPTSMSCPTAAFCAVADGTSSVTTVSRGKVYRRVLLQQGRLISAVSCTSATQCVAADVNGDAFIWNGKSWSKGSTVVKLSAPASAVIVGPVTPSRKDMIQWISSSSSGGKGAPPARNKVLTFDGTTWSSPLSYVTPGAVTALGCPPGGATCFAVDSLGYVTPVVASTSVTSASVLADPTGRALTSISCPTSDMCVVGGTGGFLARRKLTGRTSFSPLTLEAKTTVSSLTCVTAAVCVVAAGSSLSIAVADVNQDGLLDLVACSSTKYSFDIEQTLGVSGSSTAFLAAGKSKDMQGHVTLIR